MVPIETILRSYSIDFVREGPNVKHGNVYIKCPFCGFTDPSHHMGIDLKTGKWGCWRSPNHRGRDFRYLLSVLLRMPMEVIGDLIAVPTANELREAAGKLLPKTIVKMKISDRPLSWPEGERCLLSLSPALDKFRAYLRVRGYNDIERLSKEFDIRAALTGRFANRILFPVKDEWGDLRGWTGRAIGSAVQRYLSHPPGVTIKESLLFFDLLLRNEANCDTLFITEGPFDALNISYHGAEFGCTATCLFGNSATNAQITKLSRLDRHYAKVIIMLDPDAWQQTLKLKQSLAFLNTRIKLIQGSDPGSMVKEDIKRIANEF